VSEDRVPLFVRLPREQAAALDRLVDSTGRRKQHVVSELLGDQLSVGHIEIAEDPGGEDVVTLEEAAALLRLPATALRARADAGNVPGRAFGDEWRFSRSALLEWLGGRESAAQSARDRAESAGDQTETTASERLG
jgi:excisionase family DNA binding protein